MEKIKGRSKNYTFWDGRTKEELLQKCCLRESKGSFKCLKCIKLTNHKKNPGKLQYYNFFVRNDETFATFVVVLPSTTTRLSSYYCFELLRQGYQNSLTNSCNPCQHWRRKRKINTTEKVQRIIKRRTDTIGVRIRSMI